jgi:hypothetical protein
MKFPKGMAFACLVLLLVVMVPSCVLLTLREGNLSYHTAVTSSLYDQKETLNGVWIKGDIITIDTANRQLKMNFQVYGDGNVAVKNTNHKVNNMFRELVSIDFDSNTVEFPPFRRLNTQNVIASFETGDPNEYPFDVYTFNNYLVHAYTTNASKVQSFPMAMVVHGVIQGWRLSFEITDLYTYDQKTGQALDSYLRLSVKVRRSGTTLAFTLLIFILMWSLTLGALLMTLCFFSFDFAEPPLIGILATLLFALPAVRNTQPGVPPIGCTVDVAGLFWNMVIIASCIFSLMMKFFVVKYNKFKDDQQVFIPDNADGYSLQQITTTYLQTKVPWLPNLPIYRRRPSETSEDSSKSNGSDKTMIPPPFPMAPLQNGSRPTNRSLPSLLLPKCLIKDLDQVG